MNPEPKKDKLPVVGIVMGSRSDWQTMKACADVLDEFAVDYEKRIISAHRTPELLREYGMKAVARGLRVIIAGAGGAAHLPGMMASYTPLPVLGVPVESKVLRGMDSLLSIVQMPFGIPVGCLAIGESGAKNAALLAVAILAIGDKELAKKLETFRIAQTQKVLNETL
ncbi:5-(carboxyamino)imidazole ribonucleotide mutase [Candidatus Methylacidiphilum infernorum]|uniref:N5-carboxyaminoimidazole ribonucleotide mutase n=1 Tax=Methylacidiphilum infernorum (isolate V4) TaxID=481448 RepID=B3DYN3_METI4|nr:5-(carboxyamino)imidazole ribonucleotide mutase [Candidatus Methylacidiphilum infernorum]ACD84081.1 Phosphoribosylcarboxyaminoimidazole (NCAIR) mutase [Methylacidiphilum infernorum V4]